MVKKINHHNPHKMINKNKMIKKSNNNKKQLMNLIKNKQKMINTLMILIK